MSLRSRLAAMIAPEARSSYTDALVAALQMSATGGGSAVPNQTGAMEIAAGLWQRAMQGADVEGGPDAIRRALAPHVLGTVGRELIRRGESVWLIEVAGGSLRLLPAASFDVRGGADPETWVYELHLSGPSGQRSRKGIPAAAVLHFRWAVDAARPWRGLGPMQAAVLAGRLNAETDAALGNESAGPHGNLLPVPQAPNPDDPKDPMTLLRRDLGNLKGRATLVEQASSWEVKADRTGGSGPADWRARRLGADPPEGLVELRRDAAAEVLAACGVPVELVTASGASAGEREAWRRFLHGSVQPVAALIREELRAKLDTGLSLSFAELRASDLAGRARAYKQLRDAEIPDAEARRICGLGDL